MFIKTTRAKNYEYIKLVESYWENGRAHHRVLYNFGRADVIKKNQSFLNVVKRLCEIAELPHGDRPTSRSVYDDISEATLYNYGYLAYQKLWKTMGIEDTLALLQKSCSKVQYTIHEAVFLMAVQHLLEPRSKLSTHERRKRYLELNEVSLQHMYRALEKISEWKPDIEYDLFKYNYIRTKQKVDVVFYDVTTIAFESVRADGLREFGFSKDCKINEVQVVMGMVIDINGQPIGYEIYPGNTFDGKTMVAALENIRKRFGIGRVVIVADRGINCKENLNLIKEAGYGYIMSSKIKGMGTAQQEEILSADGFTVVDDKKGNEEFRYKLIPHTNTFTDEDGKRHALVENMVVTYSPKRAAKDRKDRERMVEKARALLTHPEKIKAKSKRGCGKYINRTNIKQPDTWTLADEKIEKDARFDGYYGIQTSEKAMAAMDVIEAYHTLWKIEESFRIMKSTMEIRPVFHWTPKRIEGHFVVCFLAFLMERRLELVLKEDQDDVLSSPGRIQESLNSMQLASVMVNDEDMLVRVKTDPLARKIFKVLKIGMPPAIGKRSDLVPMFRSDVGSREAQLSFL